MSLPVIVAIVVAAVVSVIWYRIQVRVDDAGDTLADRLTGDGGSIQSQRIDEGGTTTLVIRNPSRYALGLAAIEGRDANGAKVHPTPIVGGFGAADPPAAFEAFSKISVPAGGEVRVELDANDVHTMAPVSLEIIDRTGNRWTVD